MIRVSEGSLGPNVWVADTGCTNHMTPFKHLMSHLRAPTGIKTVELADNSSTLQVQAVGDVIMDKGQLKEVFYVPGLSQNLFSVRAAARNGLTHVGTKDGLMFYHGDKGVFPALLVDDLYLIKFNTVNEQVAKANATTLKVWHSRFAHVSMDTIMNMKKNKVVEDLDIMATTKVKCQDCLLNKCTRASHPTRTSYKATVAGNVLHIDTAVVCSS